MPGWFEKKSQESEVKTPAGEPARRPAAVVKISELLSEDLILIGGSKQDKHALFGALVARICEKNGLPDPGPLLAKLNEREQGISTTLDTGLSLPHARIDDLPRIVAAMATLPHGLPDPRQPDLIIRVVFMFFSPNKQESFPFHLQLLRGVSTLFQPAVIDELVKAPSPAAVLQIIRKREG